MPRSSRSARSRGSRSSRGNIKGRGAYRKRSKSRNLKGKGDYSYNNPGPWGRWGSRIGSTVGAALGAGSTFGGGPLGTLGTIAGGRMGAYAGGKLGGLAHYVGRIFGSGDYKVGTPPQVNSLFVGSKPSRTTDVSFGEKSVRFKHHEYLQDIISSSTAGAFYNQTFDINPGLYGSFPFLSALAQNFQTYKMHGLVYEFKSMSANALNSTNTALGSVIACIDYNAASGAFTGKQDMLNTMGAIDCKPSDCFLMGVECDPKKIPINELYVRTAPVPYGQDVKTYDMGVLNIASTGMQAASVNLGELHVIYDVELMMPILNNVGTTDDTSIIVFSTGGSITTANFLPDYSSTMPVINSQVLVSVDSIGLEIGSSVLGCYIAFPPSCAGGVYNITIQWTGASTPLVLGPGISGVNGLTILSDLESPSIATTTNRLVCSYTVSVPQMNSGVNWQNTLFATGHLGNAWPRLKLTAASGVIPTTLTQCSITVYRLNPALLTTTLISTYMNQW